MLASASAEALSLESAQPATACFSLAASADPGVMSRVLELFAKRGLVPSLWNSRRLGLSQDELAIEIQIDGLSQQQVRHIAACLRQIPFVASVLTFNRPPAPGER